MSVLYSDTFLSDEPLFFMYVPSEAQYIVVKRRGVGRPGLALVTPSGKRKHSINSTFDMSYDAACMLLKKERIDRCCTRGAWPCYVCMCMGWCRYVM